MKRSILWAAFAVLLVSDASAQQKCGPTIQILAGLQSKYGEAIAARGLTADGSMFTFWGNAQTGTWTILETMPGGVSCLRSAGDDFQAHEVPPGGVDG